MAYSDAARLMSGYRLKRKLLAAGLIQPKRFYLRRKGGMIFWRFGMIGGSCYLSKRGRG